MKRVLSAVQRSSWLLLLVASITLSLLAFGNGGWVLALVFGVILLGAVTGIILNLAGVNAEAEDQARRLDPDPVNRALLVRWLRRSRHFRFVGGTVGTILGFGLGGGQFGGIFLGLLAGVALGGAAAELHSFKVARAPTASASLTPREVSEYTDRRDSLALRGIAVGAVCLAVVGLVQEQTSSGTAITAAVSAVLIVALTLAFQRAVVLRPRPALSDDLRRADDLMRRLAATLGFTKAAIGVALIVIASGVASLTTSETLDTAGTITVLLWLFAFGWNVSSRHSPESIAAEVRS